ncbi:CDGSH iron-sulfur domain-containing protein [Gemmatimonas aurantiaca]|nr:CDGSH iron-sulfur domain-containing protein [Gemmatimonas aurantiaca]
MSETNENSDSSVTKLTLRRNGSILVEGKVEIIGPDGETIECKEKFALCRCGESKNKPFCDGSHKQCGFESNPV